MKLFKVKKGTLASVAIDKGPNKWTTLQHVCKNDNVFELEEMIIDPLGYHDSTNLQDTAAYILAIRMATTRVGEPVYGFRRDKYIFVVSARNVEVM